MNDSRFRDVAEAAHEAARGDWRVFLGALPRLALGLARGRGVEETLAPELARAYIPIDASQGRALYALTRAVRPRLVVEFGSSFGVSTLYLAAAVRDAQVVSGDLAPRLISTELEPQKRARALENLRRAGLADVAEIREGDARATLADLKAPIDVLFLDGWKDLYLPLLQQLTPRLAPGALVLADDIRPFRRRLTPYLAFVRSPEHGFLSMELPLGDGLELSVRTA